MNTNKLIYNAIQTPDGTILESHYRHDYKTYTDANGEEYMIDGGIDYIRTSLNKESAISLAIYSNDHHDVIREYFKWGSYGIDGNGPLTYIHLDSMDHDHIVAILRTQKHLPEHITQIFLDELEYRE